VSVAALLLGDSRFPAGGHAHSGGVEPAVTAGTVTDLQTLEWFLRGRLRTAGLVAAGLASATCAGVQGNVAPGESAALVRDHGFWAELDAEADARTPAPALREASRRQGRALLRAARVVWPEAPGLASLAASVGANAGAPSATASATRAEYRAGPHHGVVLGAAAAAAGCAPAEAARIAAYQAVAGPASAAVRLLALDPMRATGVLARLAAEIDQIAARGAESADRPLGDLPCASAPALDLLAETHIRAEVRLFES
jgi:urease accessory protein